MILTMRLVVIYVERFEGREMKENFRGNCVGIFFIRVEK